MGAGKGGVDNNPQADAIGDRGEFDTDFSGKGNLYMGAFDGKIHLVGAEWGARGELTKRPSLPGLLRNLRPLAR